MSTLRVLQICHKPPQPGVDGGCLAMDSLTQSLQSEGHDVKVLTLATHKHPFVPERMSKAYRQSTGIEAVFADTELNIRDAASHVVTGESYHLSRFHVPEMEKLIEQVLRERVFDIVLLESLFTTSYIPAIRRLSHGEIVLRAHNVEHRIWEEVTGDMSFGPKKWILQHFQGRLKEAELDLLNQVDAVVALTDLDAQWIESHADQVGGDRVLTLPFGMDVKHTPHAAIGIPPSRVLHLGSMDWTPNVQGVRWLMESVWPLVKNANPETTLCLAGRHMPEDFQDDHELGIEVVGEVANAAEAYDSPAVVVVPLHAGSGMRIKVAEALAAGRPVVTTSKGMEGMSLIHGEHVMVADNEHDMAQAIGKLLRHPDEACQLGENGRAWAMNHLDHGVLAQRLTSFLNRLVQS